MPARDDPATLPPPPGEDDAYSATTKVGAMPPDVMAMLRAEGLMPEAEPEHAKPSAVRPSTELTPRLTEPLSSDEPHSSGPMPALYSSVPPRGSSTGESSLLDETRLNVLPLLGEGAPPIESRLNELPLLGDPSGETPSPTDTPAGIASDEAPAQAPAMTLPSTEQLLDDFGHAVQELTTGASSRTPVAFAAPEILEEGPSEAGSYAENPPGRAAEEGRASNERALRATDAAQPPTASGAPARAETAPVRVTKSRRYRVVLGAIVVIIAVLFLMALLSQRR
jgi:hypothetical protein